MTGPPNVAPKVTRNIKIQIPMKTPRHPLRTIKYNIAPNTATLQSSIGGGSQKVFFKHRSDRVSKFPAEELDIVLHNYILCSKILFLLALTRSTPSSMSATAELGSTSCGILHITEKAPLSSRAPSAKTKCLFVYSPWQNIHGLTKSHTQHNNLNPSNMSNNVQESPAESQPERALYRYSSFPVVSDLMRVRSYLDQQLSKKPE